MPMQGDSKMTQSTTVPASAADGASSADHSLPEASVSAGVCGIAPHAHCDPGLGVSYSGESDVSGAKKHLEASRSPAVPRLSRDLPY